MFASPQDAEGHPYQLAADLDIIDPVRDGDTLVRQPLETIARSQLHRLCGLTHHTSPPYHQ